MFLGEARIDSGLELNRAVNVTPAPPPLLLFQTFTSMTGFRAHLKSRQRAGEISLEDSSAATPVEVKVLDTYLTVADARKLSASSSPPLGGCWSRLFTGGIKCALVWYGV